MNYLYPFSAISVFMALTEKKKKKKKQQQPIYTSASNHFPLVSQVLNVIIYPYTVI